MVKLEIALLHLIWLFPYFSYFTETELGLYPETQFVFDLELPRSFEPTNTDDQVSDYYLLPIKEVGFDEILQRLFRPHFEMIVTFQIFNIFPHFDFFVS